MVVAPTDEENKTLHTENTRHKLSGLKSGLLGGVVWSPVLVFNTMHLRPKIDQVNLHGLFLHSDIRDYDRLSLGIKHKILYISCESFRRNVNIVLLVLQPFFFLEDVLIIPVLIYLLLYHYNFVYLCIYCWTVIYYYNHNQYF